MPHPLRGLRSAGVVTFAVGVVFAIVGAPRSRSTARISRAWGVGPRRERSTWGRTSRCSRRASPWSR